MHSKLSFSSSLLLGLVAMSSPVMTQTTANSFCPIVYSVYEQMGGTVSSQQKSLSCCGWNGVTCNSGRIFQLNWQGQSLKGPIPDDLAKLTGLERIMFNLNSISGSIPESFYNLVNLTNIHMPANKLSGSISPSIRKLTRLTAIAIQNNQLTGSVPTEIGSIKTLTVCNLSFNKFSGNIPAELASLSALKRLYLNNNQFTGWPSGLNDLKITTLTVYPNAGLPQLPFDIVAQSPAELLNAATLSGMLTVAPTKRQQGARLPTFTREELYDMCPWDKLTQSDVAAGCIVGVYQTHCHERDDLSDCHHAYDTVIGNSHFSSLLTCAAWKSGPSSEECVHAIANFPVTVLAHVTLTPAIAGQFVDNILASSVFAPCHYEDCRW